MANFKIKLTTAGKAALVDDANIGTEALKIRKIEIGSSFYDPTGNEENLKNLIKSLDTFGASPGKDGIIHISIRDEAEETYNVGEIGLRTGTGVLFAVISNAEGILTTKGLNDVLLISADLEIIEADVSNVSFGPANFIYQPATEEKEGILEIATNDEMDAGRKFKAVDAEKFQSALTRRSSSKVDLDDAGKLATSAAIYALSQLIETNNNSISAINSLLQSDNEDIDTLQEAVDLLETLKSTQGSLAISNIALLQDALDAKSDIHTHPYAADDHTHPYAADNHTHPYAADNHTHPYAADNHNHDGVYGKIPNVGIGRMIFGRLYSSHQAAYPIPTVQYGGTINLTTNSRFDIRAYCITSTGSVQEGSVTTREQTGIWQCLGYAPTVGSTITMWRCVG